MSETPNRDDQTTQRPVPFEDLFLRARNGDREAIGTLLDTHRNYLLMVAAAEFDDQITARAGASDVVQESLLHAQQHFDQFQGTAESEFRAWLRAILTNDLRKTRRTHFTRKRNAAAEVSLHGQSAVGHGLVDPNLTPSSAVLRKERSERVIELLDQLPPDYAQVIRYRNFDCLAFDEIGQRMGRTADAARKLWARAIESFRDVLGNADPGLIERPSCDFGDALVTKKHPDSQ